MKSLVAHPSFKRSRITLSITLLFSSAFTTNAMSAEIYAPWLTQIGLTESISSTAKWGKGIKIGVVDSGISTNSAFFTKGQISKKFSACAAITFQCSNGFLDDEGHGTAVAGIIAGNRLLPTPSSEGGYRVLAKSVVSIASSANIIAEKVLDSSGYGFGSDIANGIIKAADAGASVINVSITYDNSSEIISSVNYAASKGAYIVWSGGNSAENLLNNANSSQLTEDALKHFLFVGSVQANNRISDFSNKPGDGALDVSGIKEAYAHRWVMAPGEDILAPDSLAGSTAWGYWTGTSMSAPLVSGSLALLQSAWPILKTNGNAADLLIATATDMGARGADKVYGNGLINLTKAFQPYGTLNVKGAKNQIYDVATLNGAMISSGALGKLSKVKSKLKNYTAFDGFERNFSVNLSNMIKSSGARALINPLPSNKKTKPLSIKLADDSIMTSWTQAPLTAFDHLGDFSYNASRDIEDQSIYLALDYQDGTTVAFGNGYSAQYAYAQAFYGDSDIAMLSSDLAADGISGLADNGKMFSYGANLSKNTRIAFAWSNSANQTVTNTFGMNASEMQAEANQIKVGLNYKFNAQVTGGITIGALTERNGLLGSQANENSAIGFGANNKSYSLGFSAAYQLNQHNHLLIEAGYALTNSAAGNGLMIGTTDIYSQSFGSTWLSQEVFQKNDQLRISIKQPLRVTSGKSGILMASVDGQGYATYHTEWASLAPTGREIDYLFSYDTSLSNRETLSLQAGYREDVMNVNGSNDASVGASYKVVF